jgi:ParB family chromosome partitioning protein
LKLEDEEARLTVAKAAIDNELNVRQTEELIDSLLNPEQALPDQGKQEVVKGSRTRVIRDVRIFVNSIKKVVADIKKVGIQVKMEQQETSEELLITMRLPLKPPAKKAAGAAKADKGEENVSREI